MEEWTECTSRSLDQRPSSVRRTFSTPDKDRPNQAPVLLHLLEIVGYPGVSNLKDDLENGFDMIGEVRRGLGWRDRDDDATATPSHWRG